MTDIPTQQPLSRIIGMSRRTALLVALVGVITGLLYWGGSMIVERYMVEPIFCGTAENAVMCANKTSISQAVGLVIATFVGLIGLIRLGVYRPLLVSIAVAITLWGVGELVTGMVWWMSLLWLVGLFTLAYLLFVWVSRLANFILALVITVVLIVGVRALAYL